MRFVSDIERWYLDFVRVVMLAIIVLSVLAVIVAAGIYLYSWIGSDEYRADDLMETPAWSEIRHSVLPLGGAGSEPCAVQGPNGVCVEDAAGSGNARVEIDPRVRQIGAHLNAQFQRNAGRETAFTDAYPRRGLEAWIKRDSAIPDDMREIYMDALVEVSKGIGQDDLINKIGSVNDRVDVVFKSLSAFRDEFALRAREARADAVQINLEERAAFENSTFYSMVIAGTGLVSLFSLALIVVLMRIEVHLRNMSNAS